MTATFKAMAAISFVLNIVFTEGFMHVFQPDDCLTCAVFDGGRK